MLSTLAFGSLCFLLWLPRAAGVANSKLQISQTLAIERVYNKDLARSSEISAKI